MSDVPRITDGMIVSMENRMGTDSFKGIARTFLLHVVTMRSILNELKEHRALVALIREEATKDNSPLGRSDALAVTNIRKLLESNHAQD